MDKISAEMRRFTLYFFAHKTNISLETMMRGMFCKIRERVSGPLHIAFAIEASSWGKRAEISTHAGKILDKFNPCRFGQASGGKFYRGGPIKGDREYKKRMGQIFRKAPGRKSPLRKIMGVDTSTGLRVGPSSVII